MTELQIFNNDAFGEVRVASINNEPYFCLADVCKVLDLHTNKVAQRLDDDVLLRYPIVDSLGRTQQATFISEAGLYEVIMRSDKTEAKAFRKWVTSEVLPSIRKTGQYSVTLPTRKELAQLVVQQEEELERLALENKQKDETIHAFTDANADLAEKNAEFVSFITSLMQNNKTIPISLFAKNYGMTAQEMNVLLQKFGIIYKCGNVWLPTKQYDDGGYTITTYIPSPFTKWTRRGVAFLYKTLKEHGYLPISEVR